MPPLRNVAASSWLVLFVLLCLSRVAPHAAADERPPPGGDLKTLQGTWTSPHVRTPDVSDATIQRTLEIGLSGKPAAVRLGWAMYCGRTRITSGDSYVGRLIGVQDKNQKRLLAFAGENGARHEVEFELSGDTLRLKGSIKGVELSHDWTRKRAATRD